MASIEKRKTKDSKVRYRALVRRKGHAPISATFDRKTDAKKWAEDKEAEIRQNKHFKYAEAKKHTVGEAIDRYIETKLPLKPKSAHVQEPQLIRWRDEIGNVKLSDLQPSRIVKVRDKLAKETKKTNKKSKPQKQRSLGTVNRYLAAFSHVMTITMKEWAWIDHNPVLAVQKFKEAKGRTRFLSDEERSRLLNACEESKDPYLYLVVIIAISTGMRKTEIMTLTWENVDLTRGIAFLFETKNSEPRAVPLTGLVLELLEKHRHKRSNSTSYLFPSPKGDWPIDIRSAWRAAVKRANIQDFKFHDLRHTTGSYLAMNGATPAEIAEVLGHKTYDMVKRYSHLSDPHTASVMKRMNESVFGEVSDDE